MDGQQETVTLRMNEERHPRQAASQTKSFFKRYRISIIAVVVILVIILALLGIFLYKNYTGYDPNGPKLIMIPQPEKNVIFLASSDKTQWTNQIDMYLEEYTYPGIITEKDQNIVNCDYRTRLRKGQVCYVDVKNWGPCSKENSYGYNALTPCVFFTMKNIYGWIPQYYNDTQEDFQNYLPSNMPFDLREHIINIKKTSPQMLNTIWVSCQGETSKDEKKMGYVRYFPSRGFPGYFYPYKNEPEYLSPLIAVHFEKPLIDETIEVICKAWARDIQHRPYNVLGSIQFQLRIEDKNKKQ